MRRGRVAAAGLLALVFAGVTTAENAPARPDRALYYQAKSSLDTLRQSQRLQARRTEWEKVVARFRFVFTRYPQSAYCDDALFNAGNLYQEMAKRFRTPRYNAEAIAAFRTLVSEYPGSSLGEQALYTAFQIARSSRDQTLAAERARAYLDVYPGGAHTKEVKAALRKSAPAQADALPSPPPPGLAQVFNLRFWSGASSTRIVIDVEREVAVKYDRIADPDRLWVDLSSTRLHPNLKDRVFPVGDGLLEQVRIAQNRSDVVRVVVDLKKVKDHTVFYLQNPTRLVIDVRGATPAPAPLRPVAEARPMATPPSSPEPSASPSPIPSVASATPPPVEEERPALPNRISPPALTPPEPPPSTAPRRSSPRPPVIEGPEPIRNASVSAPRPAGRTEPLTPQPPATNRNGGYSLARQLGLSARTIVIDAGHGGHDPGTIGRSGLQEKDLVLDVALRLEKQVRNGLGAEVVMTRASDVFIPLEERTAIANSKGADLFLSIHANSSRNPHARGIETYFLNFAQDPHAEEVAARENAISTATLKDLQHLVKAITLNSKIDESRDFASSVQESMVSSLRTDYKVVNRGIHTAPFYVLIGANMPSVLAEISFVSHPEDERLLKTPGFRDRIARSLFEGVRSYLAELDRSGKASLTATVGRSTVGTRQVRR